MKVYHHLTPQFFGRLTQAIVSTGNQVDSEPLKKLLMRYIKENLQSHDFPREAKMNLIKIIQYTNLDPSMIKDSLQDSFKGTDVESLNKANWSTAELYVKSIIELEGK